MQEVCDNIKNKMILETENIINDVFSFYLSAYPSFTKELVSAFNLMFPNINLSSHCKKETICSPIQNTHVYWSQKLFSNEHRKKKGIYYTDYDLADYVVANLIYNRFISSAKIDSINKILHMLQKLPSKQYDNLLFKQTFLDPTCGSGEFLVSIFRIKKHLYLNKYKLKLKDKDLLDICSTIYGNDIEIDSLQIAKLRIFHEIFPLLANKDSIVKLAYILNKNFLSQNWVSGPIKLNNKFDYVIGNPPYVEYGKYLGEHLTKLDCGNVYADVIVNSYRVLDKNGCIGFILPLSYTSTTRMLSLRKFVTERSKKQIILNFADRPSCLFPGVHQKNSILFSFNGNTPCKTYTSSYQYWYLSERQEILQSINLVETTDLGEAGFPKIGNSICKSIFRKITTLYPCNLYDAQDISNKSLYLNMRATFWIKAFSTYRKSSEYKKFCYPEKMYDFVLCLLNSSLFWFYWVMISDCWHITSKELKKFTIPNSVARYKKYTSLINNLENKLEKTKKYIGTVQTDYEYKHKLCKKEIDEIDDVIAKEYNLTETEIKYIKNFALKYRMGEK